MNILLAITTIWLSGNTTTENIGLFSTDQDCQIVGGMIAKEIFDTAGAFGVSFTCTTQTKG